MLNHVVSVVAVAAAFVVVAADVADFYVYYRKVLMQLR